MLTKRCRADLYLEGSDQYRGWFNSSLITSVAVSGHAPYKQVVSQGFTLDGQGHKMSKSLGNTIVPSEVIKRMGAEIVRWWVASVDSSSDVRVSMDNFTKTSDSYKKLRNTLRYLLANTTDYDPKTDKVAFADLESADQYMLIKYNKLVQTLLDDYEAYDSLNIYKRVMNFVITDLSAFYLDFAKDVVYIDPEKSQTRRSMQTVFYEILVGLTKLLTPILPHTMEEIWEYLKEPEEFVQLSEMPAVQKFDNQDHIFENWEQFKDIRSNVLKALEEARDSKMIGKSMEAQVNLYVDSDTKQLLNDLNTNVRLILIVSKLEIHDLKDAPDDAEQFKGMAVKVLVAQGSVCSRCRMTKTDVGSDDAYPALCARCAKIVRENYPESVETGLEP